MNASIEQEQETLTAADFQALLERTYEALQAQQAQIITERLRSYREQP